MTPLLLSLLLLASPDAGVLIPQPPAASLPAQPRAADLARATGPLAYTVSGAELDRWFNLPFVLKEQLKVQAVYGRNRGFRIKSVDPASIWPVLGLRVGDVVQRLGDNPLNSPEKALAAWLSVRTAARLELHILRGGKARSIVYTVER